LNILNIRIFRIFQFDFETIPDVLKLDAIWRKIKRRLRYDWRNTIFTKHIRSNFEMYGSV